MSLLSDEGELHAEVKVLSSLGACPDSRLRPLAAEEALPEAELGPVGEQTDAQQSFRLRLRERGSLLCERVTGLENDSALADGRARLWQVGSVRIEALRLIWLFVVVVCRSRPFEERLA